MTSLLNIFIVSFGKLIATLTSFSSNTKKCVDIKSPMTDNANKLRYCSLIIMEGVMAKAVVTQKEKKNERRQLKVRPYVRSLIERGVKENAPTWIELAKR